VSFSAVLASLDLLDSARVTGAVVADAFRAAGLGLVEVTALRGPRGTTDAVRVVVPGTQGRRAGGSAPTLGVVGRLGGVGARPEQIGLVSDGDGAVTAVACALKLGRMRAAGDALEGDVVIATHTSARISSISSRSSPAACRSCSRSRCRTSRPTATASIT
jgi:hypothetical protein